MERKFRALIIAVFIKIISGGVVGLFGAWLFTHGINLPFGSLPTLYIILGLIFIGAGVGIATTKPNKSLNFFEDKL